MWVKYTFAVAAASDKVACAWNCKGRSTLTGVRAIPIEGNDARRSLQAAVVILTEHMGNCATLNVDCAWTVHTHDLVAIE